MKNLRMQHQINSVQKFRFKRSARAIAVAYVMAIFTFQAQASENPCNSMPLKRTTPLMVSPDKFKVPSAISGKAISESKEDMPGVLVKIKGKSAWARTDANGSYTLSAEESDTLVFSFLGYSEVEIPVGTQTVINIEMEQDITQLNDVVLAGDGIGKKSDGVSKVLSHRGKDLKPRH